jgi:predicted MFS family arabinose efflux permease
VLSLACCASQFTARAADPMMPLIAGHFGVTLDQVAQLDTVYGMPYALTQPILGPIADAYGKSRVMKVCLTLLAVSSALCAVAPDFTSLLLVRALSGVVAGGLFPVALALIGDRVAYGKRQLAISRIVIAATTGQMVGAGLSGIIATYAGWRSVFALTAALTAAVAVALFLRLDGRADPQRRLSLAAVRADYTLLLSSRRALIVYATVLCEGLFMFGVFPFVAPTLLSRGQGGPLTAGLCISAYALGAVLYGVGAKRVIPWLGPWRMMSAGGVLVGLCYALIALPVGWPAMAALFAIAGFGFYLLHNTLQTLATELAPQARGAAVALLAASYFTGQGIGPVLSGQMAAAGGYPMMFAVNAALIAALGVAASKLLRR